MNISMRQKVYNIIIRELDIPDEAVTDDADLVKDLGMDSIDTLNILTGLQIELDVDLSEKEIIDVKTINDLVELIYSKKNQE